MKSIHEQIKSACPYILIVLGLLLTFIILTETAHAKSSGTAFDAPLTKLQAIFTGPVAFTVSLLGIVVAGATLVFGGEVSDLVKRMFMLILVISLVAFAAPLLGQIFGIAGATIATAT